MSSAPVSSPSPLLSVAEADRLLASFQEAAGGLELVPLAFAAGRILGEDIRADRAYPAQDRSRMDGIALRGGDLAALTSTSTSASCPVAGLARAGTARLPAPPPGACVEIMTGAPLPEECDTVVPYEDIALEGGVARLRAGFDAASLRAGQNVHREGSDCPAGEVLVARGARLTAAHLSIAASVGLASVRAAARPRVALVATGDELVAVDETPHAHQLRVSNVHGLAALLAPWVGPENLRIHRVGDDPAALTTLLRALLTSFDMILVSGGVSAGKFDAVPDALASLGVRRVFHKLAQKPGKPLWFGVAARRDDASVLPAGGETVVFGLPGNPVSALVCARRFVLPLLWARLGWSAPPARTVALAAAVTGPSRLTRYLPVRLTTRVAAFPDPGGPETTPEPPKTPPQNPLRSLPQNSVATDVKTGSETAPQTVAEAVLVNGSGDFATLGQSDGFLELPPTEKHYPAGAQMAFFSWSP